MPKPEDEALDLNDPAVVARLAEYVRNRHYPADTYRVQDGCANCAHVFIRQEYDHDDELFCAFRAPPRPPCMSVFMDEWIKYPGAPWGEETEGHKQWEAWKNARLSVVPQGICGEWSQKPTDEVSGNGDVNSV